MSAESPFIRLTWREAEERFGRRLDRRRSYAVYDGEETELLELATWTQSCSGCSLVSGWRRPQEPGHGCDECGYTGKRRLSMWVPSVTSLDAARRKRGES